MTAINTYAQNLSDDTPINTPQENITDPQTKQEEGNNTPSQNPNTGVNIKPLGSPVLLQYTQATQGKLIAGEIQPGEPVWLTALDKPFLATWHKEHSGTPKGAALIIPHNNTNPSQQQHIANLHHYLSANGWATLAISLPQQNKTLPPARPAPPIPKPTPTKDLSTEGNSPITEEQSAVKVETEKKDSELKEAPSKDEKKVVYDDSAEDQSMGENTPADNTSDAPVPQEPFLPPPPVEPIALARISAGINYLQEQSQFNNIVIAEGTGVARAIYFLETLNTDPSLLDTPPEGVLMQHPLRAIILINADHSLKEIPELNIPENLSSLPIPILDIHTRPFHNNSAKAKQQLSARKKTIANGKVPVYVTRTINSASVGQKGEHRLTRIIRGFLYQHAQGEEDTR